MTSSSTIEVTSSQWPSVDRWAVSTSASTTGTSPASWHAAAYLPSACAFARTAIPEGVPGPMRSTARHRANWAPSSAQERSRGSSPSRPSVTVSSRVPASGPGPASTLIPAIMPSARRATGNVMSGAACWRSISSHKITPLTPSASPGVVISISR